MKTYGKIYIFISDMALGGAERVMLSLAQEFTKTHDVEFICLRKKGALLSELPKNTSVRFMSAANVSQLLLVIRGFLGVRKIFNSNQASIVISTGTGTNLLACAARLFAPKGASLIIREACSSKNSNSRIIALMKRFLYPCADGMIGVSDGVAVELKALAGKQQPVASIPNPVDVERLQALAEAQDERLSAFPYPYLLTVGRLVRQKNTAMLIDAYAKIEAEVSEHLVIIGAGPLEAELRQRIAQHGLISKIHLMGEITNPYPWYKQASMFALSSDSEGYPNVLLEALAHGLPIVSSDCDFGPRQILENGRYGRLVKVGDLLALSDAIQASLRKAGAIEFWDAKRFSDSVIASQYLIFMESCSNG